VRPRCDKARPMRSSGSPARTCPPYKRREATRSAEGETADRHGLAVEVTEDNPH